MTKWLALSEEQKEALQQLRDRGEKAYLRERAAALLKIHANHSATQVAAAGLLRAREPETVLRWLKRFEAEGVAGLRIRAGRGRKPAFSPCGANG